MWGDASKSSSADTPIDPTNMSSTQREALMMNVKQQIAVANAQELIQRLSDKCVRKCLQKPGQSLDKYEKQCLGNCMDRFMESWTAVSGAYQQRLQTEAGAGQMGGF